MATPTSKNPKRIIHAVFTSPEAMQAWGRQLGRLLKAGDVIALVGELGAGKTTLVQGVAAGWGYKRRANSPTFSLVNEYAGPRGTLLHMDMYRLTPDDVAAFPLEDYLDPHVACLMEWADRIQPRWPKDTLQIRFHTLSPDTRRVHIVHPSKIWQKRLASILR